MPRSLMPEPLARLRAGRNPHLHRAVEPAIFHPGPERRFVHADRHDDVQVVALAAEIGIGGHVHRDVEVAGGPAARPGVALARHAHPLAVANARPAAAT